MAEETGQLPIWPNFQGCGLGFDASVWRPSQGAVVPRLVEISNASASTLKATVLTLKVASASVSWASILALRA